MNNVGASYSLDFKGDNNFSASGVYVSAWFDSQSAGFNNQWTNYVTNVSVPSNANVLWEFRTANTPVTYADATAWTQTISSLNGRFLQVKGTLNKTDSASTGAVVSDISAFATPQGQAIMIEESTTNLIATPDVPVAQDVTVTPGSTYTLSVYDNASPTGVVVINHKKIETTTSDFGTGTLSGVTASGNSLVLDTATADPTFTRATTATKRDGTSASSGVARYEDVIRQFTLTTQGDFDACAKTGPIQTSPAGNAQLGVIEDGFDTDTSWAYTGATTSGSITPTFNTGSSRLELLTTYVGSNGTYTYNNFSAKNVAVEMVLSQSFSAGLIARYTDVNNYYLAFIQDNTVSASNNVRFYKVVAGVITALGSAVTTTFTRGTQYKFRFEVLDSVLALYKDDVLVTTLTDSSITSIGKVGIHTNSSATATLVHSFKIDAATPLHSRSSAANNPQTGAAVTSGLPRYQLGKNLLSKNQSDCETDTTGFGPNAAGTTITRDTTEYYAGTSSIKASCSGGAANQGIYCTTQYFTGVFPAGSVLKATAYVKGTSSLQIIAKWYYSDGTSSSSAGSFTATSTWTRYGATVTATAGKTIQRAQLLVVMNGTIAGDFYVDNLQLEINATASTTWVPGGDNAILVEEGTTNLMQSGAETFTNGSGGCAVQDGSVLTRTTGISDPFGGTSAVRLELTAGGATQTNKFSMTSSVSPSVNLSKYCGQVWVKNNSATAMSVNFLPALSSVTVNQSDGWKLVKLENMTGNGVNSVSMQLLANTAADSIDVSVMWPQMEAKAYCTSYIAPGSSRNGEALCLSSNLFQNSTSGTVVIRAYFSGELIAASPASTHYLLTSGSSGNALVLSRDLTSPNLRFALRNSAGSTTTINHTTLLSEGWHTVGIKWDSTFMKIYVDGVKSAEQASPTTIPSQWATDFFLGGNGSSTTSWNAPIDDFSYYPSALTDAEMVTLTTNS